MGFMKVVSARTWSRSLGLLGLAVAGSSISCSRSGGDAVGDLDGVATLALTATEGVISVKIDFQGASRTVSRCVEVDGAATTQLRGLPTGTVLVNASAYPVHGCAGEPTWLAEPQSVQLTKGRPVAISIVFRPNGTAIISTTYVDDGNEPDGGGTDGSGGGLGTPFTVQANLLGPAAVATDGWAVVWTDSSGVRLCSVDGCGAGSPWSLYPEMFPGKPAVNALVLSGPYAYWVRADYPVAVERCPLTGCDYGPQVMVLDGSIAEPLSGLAVHSSTVYVNDDTTLYQCPTSVSHCKADEVFGGYDSSPAHMAADATGLYFSMSGQGRGTYYCPFASCPPTFAVPLVSSIGRIAAYGGTVYVLNWHGEIASCPNTGCSNIMTTLATGQSDVTAMAADSFGLYWTISHGADAGLTGEVRMCPLPDCEGGPRVLATAQANPVSIAASQGHVFWVNRGLTGSNGSIEGVTVQ